MDHVRISLTFVTIVAAGVGAISASSRHTGQDFLLQCLSAIGFVVSCLAPVAINRVRQDHELKFSQINRIEDRLEMYAKSKAFLFISHSKEAVEFFAGREIHGKKFTPAFLRRYGQLLIIDYIFALFAAFFVVSMTGIYSRFTAT